MPKLPFLRLEGVANVQGIGSVGVTPKLKDELFENLTNKFGVKLPTTKGRDTLECLEAAKNGQLKFGLCLGGNLYGSNPDSQFADSALANLDLLVMPSQHRDLFSRLFHKSMTKQMALHSKVPLLVLR